MDSNIIQQIFYRKYRFALILEVLVKIKEDHKTVDDCEQNHHTTVYYSSNKNKLCVHNSVFEPIFLRETNFPLYDLGRGRMGV